MSKDNTWMSKAELDPPFPILSGLSRAESLPLRALYGAVLTLSVLLTLTPLSTGASVLPLQTVRS